MSRTVGWALLVVTGLLLAIGGAAWWAGHPGAADIAWAVATVVALVPAVWMVAAELRRGRTGVDAIAVLALAGSLAVGEYLAGALVGLMLATGQTLERYAEGRAVRDLRALVAHAPRQARRRRGDPADGLEEVPLAAVTPGDRLVVGPGEVVPVDGVCEDPASLDESVITGESLLVDRQPGDPVPSGAVNAGPAFGIRAEATAADSTYAGIVALAEQATAESAPTVRLADRYAAWFLPAAVLVAGAAWLWSGDPVRAVAVLVVATPCPLLLATPIAIVSGMSRAARRGVVVRGGGALERLGRARTLLLDKTGTLTGGRPELARVVPAPGGSPDEVVRYAAAVEQVSPHVLARTVVTEAARRSLRLPVPRDVSEEPGVGVTGTVDGEVVRVGQASAAFHAGQLPQWAVDEADRAHHDGAAVVWVSRRGTRGPAASAARDAVALPGSEADRPDEGEVLGLLLLRDPVRPDAADTVRRLRRAGLSRLVMVSGDQAPAAQRVAREVGLDEVVAECTPADKVAQVRREAAGGAVVMVGDGVNDAPALAAADVGVAMAGRNATAAAEVADAVMTVDRLDRLADTVSIAYRSRRIAVQSAAVGMGLSLVAMGFAAAGALPPAWGALLQEGIDVVVIVNALRALTPGLLVMLRQRGAADG